MRTQEAVEKFRRNDDVAFLNSDDLRTGQWEKTRLFEA
jgi:hypothetical protein